MAIYKYKRGGRGSLYVPGEEIPEHVLKKEGLSNERNKEITAEEVFRKMNSDVYEETYKKYSPRKEKIQRIYEDDDFIIDLFPDDQIVRVSIFKDNHFVDEVFVKKAEYCMYGGVC